ncbi:hypothetical protein AAFF_G00009210 [Aldrovandia affinis]|uniref:G protein-coupled receptor 39 n=1 Tax=Aldrovandia affinis TaxID=143900 RepID=A0AAD7T6T1_9TELE|nr:hypothetical protein AAFF_G00009210 [Aldrovandia affinis]
MMAARPKSDWTLSYFRANLILHPIADTFFYLSSVLNPFLYNLSSRQFRRVFVQVLHCRLTIEHINKRTLNTSEGPSDRSVRPLLIRSLRRGWSTHTKTLTTFQMASRTHPHPHPEGPAEPSESSELSAVQESGQTSQSEI